MTKTIEAPIKPFNGSALAAELQAAAGEASQGWSAGAKWPDVILLHFADGAPQTAIDAALQAYAAHDPSVLTADQRAEAERAAAVEQLANLDFTALTGAVEGAITLEDARGPLLAALGALGALTKALGLKPE